jgi:hypothetical protein
MVVETNISSCERNRPLELGGSAQSPAPPEQLDEAPRPLVGGTMKAEEVAERVLQGIREGSLYILTHEAAAPYVRRRFERIEKAFGP